jgi:hypothetical protein
MRADALPAMKGPTILCLQAGNLNTGAFDPFEAIIPRARSAWIHVDAAFGLWATAAPGLRHLVKGLEHADSWAADAHKWLNVPYDSGLAFVRDAHTLKAAMAITAEYEVLDDVVLDQVLVSFGTPERTREVIGRIQRDGTCWCGGTVWQGKTAMRISVCSWATRHDDVERSLAAMVRAAAE